MPAAFGSKTLLDGASGSFTGRFYDDGTGKWYTVPILARAPDELVDQAHPLWVIDEALGGKLGEVQASPTANTVLDRLKTLATLVGEVQASPTANTVLDRLKTAGTHLSSLTALLGRGTMVDVTPTLDTSAYAAGDVLFDATDIANAMRANDAGGYLDSIGVIDKDDQGAEMDLFLLSANVSLGTANAAPSISDANAANILSAPIKITAADYVDLGGVKVAGVDGIAKRVKPVSGARNVYVAALTRGTPTHTASGLALRFGFAWD